MANFAKPTSASWVGPNGFNDGARIQVRGTAEWVKIYIDPEKIENLDSNLFTPLQIDQIKELILTVGAVRRLLCSCFAPE